MSKQCERLEAYLEQRGSITALDAWAQLGIARCAARVLDLRNRGMNITTESTKVQNRYGETCTVARYRLQEPQQELFA